MDCCIAVTWGALTLNREQEICIVRRAYAKQVLASVNVNNARVEAAFAAVERETYLGLGPWLILRSSVT